MPIEDRLRSALRRVEPERDLAAGVLARLEAGDVAPQPRRIVTMRWAIAAGLLLVFGTGVLVQQQRQHAAREAAGRQLAYALELTSRELEVVHRRFEPRKLEETGT